MDIVIVSMTPFEAMDWKNRVGSQANNLRVLINEGYERQAWKALGYSNWTECIGAMADEFGLSERRLWQLQAANETEKLLNHCSVGMIPERQLRPLARLEPEQQRQVWQQVTETPGPITAAKVQAAVDEYREAARPHVSNNSGENEWYTPPEFTEAASRVMGAIDLDPASSAIANRTVGASLYYSKDDNGLMRRWAGRIFMNPPYAAELIGKFCEKLVGHYVDGDITEAIVLVNNSTETGWFNQLVGVADAVVFPKTRVKFLDPQGNPGAPLQGQAIIYMGNSPDQFIDEFSSFGWGARICSRNS